LKGRAGLICQGVASRLVGLGLGGRSLVVDQAFEASLEILLNLMPLNDGATHSFCIQHDASHKSIPLYEWQADVSPKTTGLPGLAGHRTS